MKARRKAEGGRRKASAQRAGTFLTLCLALFVAGTVAAQQVLNDPTRPPAGVEAGVAESAGDSGGGMQLQSVLISPTQKAAIIGGVMVRLGEKYGDAVLVRVAENEVVLKSGGAQQVLKLHPGVEKREIAPAGNRSTQRQPTARPGAAAGKAGGAQGR